MSGGLILDSNAIIDFFDGNEAVDAAMRKASRVLVPAVVYGEIQAGCQGTTRPSAPVTLISLVCR